MKVIFSGMKQKTKIQFSTRNAFYKIFISGFWPDALHTVAENVGKFYQCLSRTEKKSINELLEIVEMTEFADVKTSI
jgi:hypothetical protein